MELKEKYIEEIKEVYSRLQREYPAETHRQDLVEAVNLVVEQDTLAPQVKRQKSSPVRGYIDGCFDIMHSGHYNAIRQAKALCDVLVVGVHSDKEIMRCKGPPVMNEEERLALVKGCKWADEVVFDTPYEPSLELLDRHNCDFGVHGDDMPTNPDGVNAYSALSDAGRLKIIQRTAGVSTTDLVGRLLLMTKDHHSKSEDNTTVAASSSLERKDSSSRTSVVSSFLPTSCRISSFSNHRAPTKEDTVVYVDGAYDLFHVGHVEFLEAARKLGTFLIVGVHSDEVVNKMKGQNYPIMSVHERVLNVLSTKWVDEVVIGAPWSVTEDMINSFNIKVVAQGTMTKMTDFGEDAVDVAPSPANDPYTVPKRLGIYKTIQSPRSLMTINVVERIIVNRMKYIKRNEVRAAKEAKYLQEKVFVVEA